jgi:hypothetical protein
VTIRLEEEHTFRSGGIVALNKSLNHFAAIKYLGENDCALSSKSHVVHDYIIVVFCPDLSILQAASVEAKTITNLVLVSKTHHFTNGPAAQLSIEKAFIITGSS